MTKITIDRSVVEQALEALEVLGFGLDPKSVLARDLAKRIDALRAALAEPVPGPQGCGVCNHPLYAGIKCRVCGREKA